MIDLIRDYISEHVDNFKGVQFEIVKAIFDNVNNTFLVETETCSKERKYVRISHDSFTEYKDRKLLEEN